MTSETDKCVAPLDNSLAAVSLNTSFFAFKGLKDYGYGELANAMRHNLLQW